MTYRMGRNTLQTLLGSIDTVAFRDKVCSTTSSYQGAGCLAAGRAGAAPTRFAHAQRHLILCHHAPPRGR